MSITTPPPVDTVWPELHNLIWEHKRPNATSPGKYDLSKLRKCLTNEGCDIGQLTHHHSARDMTVLHTASDGSVELTELLLKHGADKLLEHRCGPGNEGRHAGQTPLQMAARNGNVEVARLLIKHGANYDIFSACAIGDEEQFLKLVHGDARVLRMKDDYEATPLHWSALAKSPAAKRAHITTLLLESNRDMANHRDLFGETPILAASTTSDNEEVINCLLNDAEPIELETASAIGDINRVSVLVEKESSKIQKRNCHGTTPLHWAARNGHLESAKLLLDSGADINAVDSIGCPPLWYAAYWRQDVEVVRLLCDRGARVDLQTIWGTDIRSYDIGYECSDLIMARMPK